MVMAGNVVFQANMSRSIETTVGEDWYRIHVVCERYIAPNKDKQTTDNHRKLQERKKALFTVTKKDEATF